MAIRLVMVDDHPLVLGGLQQLLGTNPEFEVVDTCSTVADGWPWMGLVAVFAAVFCAGGTLAFGPLIDE